MRDRLLNKLINPSPYSITNQIPKFLTPMFSYVVLQRILQLKIGKLYDELSFKMGKSLGRLITNKLVLLNKNASSSRLIRIFLKEFENLGFGQGLISRLNLKVGICMISNATNPIAKQYKKTFGNQKENIDFFLAGLYAGCLSKIIAKDCFFVEKECISKNKNFCIFYLTFDNPFKNEVFEQEEIDNVIIWENLYSEHKSLYPNTLIQKIIDLGQLKLKSGKLTVWNVYCAFFPMPVFLITFGFLDKKKIGVSKELCYMAAVQAKIAILFQINKFGITNKMATFNSLLNQLELFGVGNGKIIKLEHKKLIARFSNSYSLFQFKAMFKDSELIAYIQLNGGSILGMVQYSLGKNVKSIKHKIINNDIYYTIGFARDKKESLIGRYRKEIKNKHIIGIIEERMEHKYYLLG